MSLGAYIFDYATDPFIVPEHLCNYDFALLEIVERKYKIDNPRLVAGYIAALRGQRIPAFIYKEILDDFNPRHVWPVVDFFNSFKCAEIVIGVNTEVAPNFANLKIFLDMMKDGNIKIKGIASQVSDKILFPFHLLDWTKMIYFPIAKEVSTEDTLKFCRKVASSRDATSPFRYIPIVDKSHKDEFENIFRSVVVPYRFDNLSTLSA